MRWGAVVGGLLVWAIGVRAQVTTREQLVGTWIGVHSEWDTDFTCPLPTFIRLAADGRYHLGMVDGSAAERAATWDVKHDTVRLDTNRYAPRLIRIQNDLLRIGTRYPMVFRRFSDAPVDSTTAVRHLTGRVWQSDSLIVYLHANGRVALENPSTKQRTVHFWQLVRFGQSVFLVIRGNAHNRDSGYKPLWQLIRTTPTQLTAIGWDGRAVGTQSFRRVQDLVPTDSCQPSGFQPCNNCFTRMWYDASLGRSARRYELEQLVAKQYRPVPQPGQTGLVCIRFVVNCQGEQGMIDVTGFGDDYCPRPFDAQITGQLLTICQNYAAAEPSLRDSGQPDGRPQDVSVSLTFRLKDGRLTHLLP